MADKPTPTDEKAAVEKAAEDQGRLDRLVNWAKVSRFRMALVGSLAFVALGGTFATWSYLAHLAVSEENLATLARALEAMDNKDFEEARSIVGRMENKEDDPHSLGGSLFVLGAVKAAEAEQEWSADRKRAIHLVAARYLDKAHSLGVPPIRESQLSFLLGQSLILGNQPQAGIDVLQKTLGNSETPISKVHGLLSGAYLEIPEPDLKSALKHNLSLLEDNSLTKERRTMALISQVDILRQLGNIKKAREVLATVRESETFQALALSISGQLELSAAEQLPKGDEQASRIKQAIEDLSKAQRLDPLNGELSRQAMYWIGQCMELSGNNLGAIDKYDRIGKLFGDTPESIASTLSKGNLERERGNIELALADYRSVLEAVGEPLSYVNSLLPLSKLRKQMLRAHATFVERKQFEHALSLVNQFPPVFDQIEVTELRGMTHEMWGNSELEQASRMGAKHKEEKTKAGRYHLRAAGRDFENLAKLRFATREFPEDLWRAAENYYQGQSYTHAADVLEEYLYHEARTHKARALLRLGQSLSASYQTKKAIASFEECIEMHPRDADVYQARLDCVRAYRQIGNNEKSEELLLTNKMDEGLKPSSPEWRDSLFALGELYHDLGRFEEAIKELTEAIVRYPNAPQAILSRYTIARSYHSAAEKPAAKIKEAKTESERQKNRKLRDQNLDAALQNYLIVQRMISSDVGQEENNELRRALLRNCYMMQGSVLFQLKRYEEARKAYSNVSTLYQNEPFVLESFVHIANCWSRLNQPVKARGTIEQAKLVLDTLPLETDFKLTTNFNRQQWDLLLNELSKW